MTRKTLRPRRSIEFAFSRLCRRVNKSVMDKHDSFRPDPYIMETTKVAELKDHFGNTRFKVALTDFDGNAPAHDDLVSFDMQFQVTVVSYCYSEDAVTVVCREFDMYEKAVRFFREMVSRYSALVKAETRDYQDINIYAGKTGYHKICPDCCAVCKWAKAVGKDNCLFEDWKKNHRGKFLCMNVQLYVPDRRDMQPDCGQHDQYHDFAKSRFHVIDIHPEVDADGICKGFERNSRR